MRLDLGAPAALPVLRDYQLEAVERLRENIRKGIRRQILCAATGAGKTVIAGHMIRQAVERGKRVAFVVDRRVLVRQAHAEIAAQGIHAGTIQADNTRDVDADVLVCSAQTCEKRGWPAVDLAFVDECHIQRKSVQEWTKGGSSAAEHTVGDGLPARGDAGSSPAPPCTIGLSATPMSRGLAKHWGAVVNVRSTDALIEDGWLVRPRIFRARARIDMDGAAVAGTGEWSGDELADRGMRIVGDVVPEWKRVTQMVFGARVPKTVVFAPGVNMMRDLREQFESIGVRAETYSYLEPDEDVRRQVVDAFRAGKIDVLLTVEALQRGFDVPDVECIVDAHPWRKAVHCAIQQWGRGMRPAPGKDTCIIIDHAENYERLHERIYDVWANGVTELDDGTGPGGKSAPPLPPSPPSCRECGCAFGPRDQTCQQCGAERPRRQQEVVAGDVKEVGEEEVKRKRQKVVADRKLWRELKAVACIRRDGPDRQRKYATGVWRTCFGAWPPWSWRNDAPAALVSEEALRQEQRARIIWRHRRAA